MRLLRCAHSLRWERGCFNVCVGRHGCGGTLSNGGGIRRNFTVLSRALAAILAASRRNGTGEPWRSKWLRSVAAVQRDRQIGQLNLGPGSLAVGVFETAAPCARFFLTIKLSVEPPCGRALPVLASSPFSERSDGPLPLQT